MVKRSGRRDYGSGSVYQRASDGRWIAAVELGWEHGSRKRKTISGKTKADVVAKLRKLDPDTAVTNAPTVETWLRRWLDEIAAPRVTPKALKANRADVEHHLIPFIGRHRLDKLAPVNVVRLHQTLRERGKVDGGPLAESSVLRAHAVLSKALEDACRLGLIPRNVAQQVDRPGKGHAEAEFLDATQAAALLKHVADEPLGSRWAFALLTGQRQGECLGLRWSHLDLDRGIADVSWQLQRFTFRHGCRGNCGRKTGGRCPQRVLNVRASYEHIQLDGGLTLCRPKARKRKVLPLIPSLIAWLRRYRDEHPPGAHDLVWTRDDGRPIELSSDYLAWVDLLDRCGLPRVELHSARHSCVSLLMSLGVTETVIMQIVGHSVVATTRGYAHVDVEAARAALRRLGQVLQLEELPADAGEVVDVDAD